MFLKNLLGHILSSAKFASCCKQLKSVRRDFREQFDLSYSLLLVLWALGLCLGMILISNAARFIPLGPYQLFLVMPIFLWPILLNTFMNKLAMITVLQFESYFQKVKPHLQPKYQRVKPRLQQKYQNVKPYLQIFFQLTKSFVLLVFQKTRTGLFNLRCKGRRISMLICLMGCVISFGVLYIQPLIIYFQPPSIKVFLLKLVFEIHLTDNFALTTSASSLNHMLDTTNAEGGLLTRSVLLFRFFILLFCFWLGLVLSLFGAIGAVSYEWTYGRVVRWVNNGV
ncbi:MAG: hypothetical protein Q7J38_04565 [Gallionella sp.]|nr:hypothetical protein [Gallionella sp.]